MLDDEGDPAITAATKIRSTSNCWRRLYSSSHSMVGWLLLLATNRSDQDAEASFQVLVHAATSKKMANDASDQAVWLVDGFTPGPKSVGVLAAAKMGAKTLSYVGSHVTYAWSNWLRNC